MSKTGIQSFVASISRCRQIMYFLFLVHTAPLLLSITRLRTSAKITDYVPVSEDSRIDFDIEELCAHEYAGVIRN